jgi:hypothetical protein
MTAGYHLILASSVGVRDGMALELTREGGTRVAEVFEDDESRRRTLTVFEENVPLEAIEWLIAEAKTQL